MTHICLIRQNRLWLNQMEGEGAASFSALSLQKPISLVLHTVYSHRPAPACPIFAEPRVPECVFKCFSSTLVPCLCLWTSIIQFSRSLKALVRDVKWPLLVVLTCTLREPPPCHDYNETLIFVKAQFCGWWLVLFSLETSRIVAMLWDTGTSQVRLATRSSTSPLGKKGKLTSFRLTLSCFFFFFFSQGTTQTFLTILSWQLLVGTAWTVLMGPRSYMWPELLLYSFFLLKCLKDKI